VIDQGLHGHACALETRRAAQAIGVHPDEFIQQNLLFGRHASKDIGERAADARESTPILLEAPPPAVTAPSLPAFLSAIIDLTREYFTPP
jgi:hypothetical protein